MPPLLAKSTTSIPVIIIRIIRVHARFPEMLPWNSHKVSPVTSLVKTLKATIFSPTNRHWKRKLNPAQFIHSVSNMFYSLNHVRSTVHSHIHSWSVVSTPLKNMSSSVGMMMLPIYYIHIYIYIWKVIKFMFQTTNQIAIFIAMSRVGRIHVFRPRLLCPTPYVWSNSSPRRRSPPQTSGDGNGSHNIESAQRSCWNWPFIVHLPIKRGDFP